MKHNVMNYRGCIGAVEYSERDDTLHGRLVGINGVQRYSGRSVDELRIAFQNAVDAYLKRCATMNRNPHRVYSGKFTLRLDPVLHAQLARKAEARGVSLNTFVLDALKKL